MNIEQASALLLALNPDETEIIYTTTSGIEVIATRTDELGLNDFTLGLKNPDSDEFNLTFVRLLIDLHLKIKGCPDKIDSVSEAFEKIYDGHDCKEIIENIEDTDFPMQLDGLDINLMCAQLLMVKQDINYGPGKRNTSYTPARGYLMAFIRWVLSCKNQIDEVVTAAVKDFIPPEKFDKGN